MKNHNACEFIKNRPRQACRQLFEFSNSAIQQFSNSAIQQFSNSAIQQFSNNYVLDKAKKIFFIILFFIGTSACSLDANIANLAGLDPLSKSPLIEDNHRKSPDTINGEVVVTANGVVGVGVFGDIAERKVTDSGVEFSGVFYE